MSQKAVAEYIRAQRDAALSDSHTLRELVSRFQEELIDENDARSSTCARALASLAWSIAARLDNVAGCRHGAGLMQSVPLFPAEAAEDPEPPRVRKAAKPSFPCVPTEPVDLVRIEGVKTPVRLYDCREAGRLSIRQMSDRSGISFEAMRSRINRGWDPVRAMTQPFDGSKTGRRKGGFRSLDAADERR